MNVNGQKPQTLNAPSQPAIFAQIGAIDCELSSAFTALSRLESVYQRVMNPAPQAVGGQGTATPTQPTLEARLNDTGKAAASLAGELHALADRFEKAI